MWSPCYRACFDCCIPKWSQPTNYLHHFTAAGINYNDKVLKLFRITENPRREDIQQEGRIQEGRYPRREISKKGRIQEGKYPTRKKAQLSTSFLRESWAITNIKTSKTVSSWLWRKLFQILQTKIMVAELQ